ncbi:MAG: class I SAM-dependent methyltransferase [Candidatus Kryptoniota bacterium]
MGKKVLRPGGRKLTLRMIETLGISTADSVVEFAPGMGSTAKLVFAHKPRMYFGIDQNETAIERLSGLYSNNGYKFIRASIANSGLPDDTATVVLGEAVLTMQTDERKGEIIKEAYRVLERGGRYAIHEIGLLPDDASEAMKEKIREDLSGIIRVNALPLTITEWKNLFREAGFAVENVLTTPMHLLKPARLVSDEGIPGTLRILYNVLTTPGALKRVSGMRSVFNKHEKSMTAVSIIARKE